MTQEDDGRADWRKVHAMIKDIKVALFVTHAEGDGLRSRPMAAMRGGDEGPLWFASRDDTAKIHEIADHTQVLLAYSEPKTQNYVSVSGRASVVRDRAQAAELWTESMRVWFPKGADDPEMVLIRVEVDGAEYWDSPSSAWIQSVGYAKVRLTGEPLRDVGRNERVSNP